MTRGGVGVGSALATVRHLDVLIHTRGQFLEFSGRFMTIQPWVA
jgi:hypothetical protein